MIFTTQIVMRGALALSSFCPWQFHINHRDEDWSQQREKECIAANEEGQPKSSSTWKISGIPNG